MTPQIIAAQTKIQALKQEKLSLRLPTLSVIEAAIQHHTARAVIDPAFKPALQTLLDQKQDAENAWKRNGDINGEISLLEQEITYAEQQERQARIKDAERAYVELKNEFIVAGKQLCRLQQQLVAMNNRNSQTVPGWRSQMPLRFNIELMNPSGWTGDTSDMLPLPWMNQEKEKAA